MTKETREIIALIIKLIEHKRLFFFWIFIRFISAIFPLISIYLFSQTIKEIEKNASITVIFGSVILILFIYILENFTKLLSIQKLSIIISNTEFAIHDFLLINVNTKDEFLRHKAVQTVRNFGEAVRTTLELVRQPGIDSIVSLITIPIILFFVDFKVLVAVIAFIVTHYFVDLYTTQKYIKLRDIQNAKTENYFAKIQESSDTQDEERQYGRQFAKLAHWGFFEGFILHNISAVFYSIILLYLLIGASTHQIEISNIILITGYVASVQLNLASISTIKDKLADTRVALIRLTRRSTNISVDMDDLLMR